MPINEWSDDILIAELNDEPAFSEEMDALLRRLEAVTGPAPAVVLDGRAVSYLNSSNIAQMLKLRKKLIDSGSGMRVCGLSDTVWSIMLVTGLDKVFTFTEDVSTALASIQLEGA